LLFAFSSRILSSPWTTHSETNRAICVFQKYAYYQHIIRSKCSFTLSARMIYDPVVMNAPCYCTKNSVGFDGDTQ